MIKPNRTAAFAAGICCLILLASCSEIPGGNIFSPTVETAGQAASAGTTDQETSGKSASETSGVPAPETAAAPVQESAAAPSETAAITAGPSATTEPSPTAAPEPAVPGNQYTMNLTLDTAANTIGGTERVVIQNDSDDDWDKLCFRDYPSLFTKGGKSGYDTDGAVSDISHMRDITNNMDLIVYRDTEDLSVVYVQLGIPLKAGESRTVEFEFTAHVPELGSRFGYTDGIYNLGNFYPVLSVYENGGWSTEKYFSYGECFYSVVSDYRITLSVPLNYRVISSGLSSMNTVSGGRALWTVNAPRVRDFAMIAGEDFEVVSDAIDGVTVRSYYMNGDEYRGRTALQAGLDSVRAFNAAFGEYPYPELDIVETYLDALGMEYPNIVMISESVTNNEGSVHGSFSRLENVIAHEIGHQWFYGLVGDNQFTEAWLDESFASYSEWVYEELFLDKGTLDYHMFILSDSLEPETNLYPDDYFCINKRYDEFGSDHEYVYAVYKNGAVFLYRLRDAMGPEAFDQAMHAYVAGNMYNVATTEAFSELFLTKAGENGDVAALFQKYLGCA